jgi:hypothetical protein
VKDITNFFTEVIIIAGKFIFWLFLFLIFAFLHQSVGLNGTLEVLKVVIWPLVLLLALVFFKEIFTYMFFSMREFNFFGAKGRLKNVQQLISEKVKEQLDREKFQKQNEESFKQLSTSKNSLQEKLDNTLNFAQQLIKDAEKLYEENLRLRNSQSVTDSVVQAQVNALLTQIAELQAQIANIEKK